MTGRRGSPFFLPGPVARRAPNGNPSSQVRSRVRRLLKRITRQKRRLRYPVLRGVSRLLNGRAGIRTDHTSAVERGPNQQHHEHNHHRHRRVRWPDLESPRSVQLLARQSSPLFREGLRDLQRNRLRIGKRNVGHHGDDKPAFGKRHEVRRAADELLFAAMARHPRGLARKRMRLDLPAKTVAGLRARGQPLRRLQPFLQGSRSRQGDGHEGCPRQIERSTALSAHSR
jgi:hypothetical protein